MRQEQAARMFLLQLNMSNGPLDLYLRKMREQENKTYRKRNGHLWQGSNGYESDLQRNSASM